MPERFYVRLPPVPVIKPGLIRLNVELARELGLDPNYLASPEGIAVMAGSLVPPGAEPLAMAYAGHQFGSFVPQLGDGRAILLGEVVGRDGARRDIQLKGSGQTPFSRRGDGRAALGPVLREFIIAEAMHALGIPTTRALAALRSGETVLRETPLPGAILVRIASSHIRVGTFQYFAARGDRDAVRQLADYVIARHYPDAGKAEDRYLALLDGVIARQADLIAKWLHVGFIHGVMNTDNMSIAGETIDYGPCAFMDAYHPATVFSSIDEGGRYAYGNQPAIAQWNLTRLAEALLTVLADDQEKAIASAEEALGQFAPRFNRAFSEGLSRKLGIRTFREGDLELGQELLKLMAANNADFTLTFRALAHILETPSSELALKEQFADRAALDGWLPRWRGRLALEETNASEQSALMRANNPAIIPRNHRVEEAIAAATNSSDYRPFEALLEALSQPFSERPGSERFAAPPKPDEVVLQTFCGT